MTEPKLDCIIVGQGLAGSLLAYRLLELGRSVMVIDNSHHNSSTKIAAGMINPITGHRLNLTDGFERYFPIARQCYADMERQLGEQLLSLVGQQRQIKNLGQLSFLQKRLEQPEYNAILSNYQEQPSHFREPKEGSISIGSSAIVDCKRLLSCISAYLEQRDSISFRKVDYNEIRHTGSSIQLGEHFAKSIIFCEGASAIHNPWLNKLPFKLAQGEILSVELEQAYDGKILNWGNWLAPTNTEQIAKLGSSFDWHLLNLKPKAGVSEKLMASLRDNTYLSGKIIEHEVGIRPTTKNRLPFVGALSNFENAYCFNGFGSKGCLTVPYYSELLCNHITNQTPIPEKYSRCL